MNIQKLTLTSEIHINVNLEGNSNFVIESTANHLCSFGITINAPSQLQDTSEINQKKLVKLEKSLERMLQRTTPDGYKRNVSEIIQKKDSKKVISINHTRNAQSDI